MKKAYNELDIELIWFGKSVDIVTASNDTDPFDVNYDEDEE